MARVTLLAGREDPGLAPIIGKIRGARGGQLHDFYRALLHSPALAEAWFDFNNAVRFRTGLDDRLREIVIIRVAWLTRTGFVVDVHRNRYAEAAGVSRAEVDALARWSRTRLFSRAERAALRYTDAVTRDVAVPGGVYARLRKEYGEREIVELTVLIAAYNMHVRFLRALDIGASKA